MQIKNVMTKDVVIARVDDSLESVAKMMRDHDIGDVLVVDAQSALVGIITDRDITVRAVANGVDPGVARAGDTCTRHVETVAAETDVRDAIERMRDKAIRRIPVIQNGRLVGIVSIGDLAQARDADSVLGQISAAPPNN
jgi:CBS domain-containing protein